MSGVLAVDLEQQVEADDGVVEVGRVLPHLSFGWAVLPEGPRRWAPADLSVDADEAGLQAVRMTYRSVGGRVVVVVGARVDVDVDWLAERVATPLLFADFRRMGGGLPPAAIMTALRGEPAWTPADVADVADVADGAWRGGQSGVGERPVRLQHRVGDGHLLVAAHGVAGEELQSLARSLEPLRWAGEAADALHTRYRRALAQRWWDAPRVPWTPQDQDR